MKLRQLFHSAVGCAAFAAASAFVSSAAAAVIVFSDSGANAAAIQAEVDAFRTALGALNPNAPIQSFPGGRREINWDGGGAVNGTAPVTPFNGFLNARGASFTTPGTGLTQAPITGPVQSLELINPTYAATFSTFSPLRLFAPIGSNVTDATFAIPGSNGAIPARVSAFGAIFTDVDRPDSTSMQFFDNLGASLGIFDVPAGPSGGLSFLGVSFDDDVVARVRIITGSAALGPNDNPGGGIDLVVMDDFIYAEPQRLAEPATLGLLGLALVALGLARRQR